MKIAVRHNLDDFNLVQGILAARRRPTGVHAVLLTALNTATAGLLTSGWGLVLSSSAFGVPDPTTSIRWASILVGSSFVFALLTPELQTRFTENGLSHAGSAGETHYELRAEGLVRTTGSSRTLFYWTPEFVLERDTLRYFMYFGTDVLLVVPARAFATYADFAAFGSTAAQFATDAQRSMEQAS